MIKTLIPAFPDFKREFGGDFLEVSEFFFDSIQGEGINIGHPAAFLRLQYCTLNCVWCDSREVWRKGNPYTFIELFVLMETQIDGVCLIDRLKNGQHLVITGGSPLKYQKRLIEFLYEFVNTYSFIPYIEIENECVVFPDLLLSSVFVSCWNNSPKLSNSGNPTNHLVGVLKHMASLKNSWFKFVISSNEDWKEIVEEYLETNLISISQIILMPQGATREELIANREKVIEIAIENGVRYCTREHIVLWDKKTGV